MPRPPKIGVNCDHFSGLEPRVIGVREPYLRAIEEAGGIPLAIPFLASEEQIEAALDGLDGFLLTGGDDLRPERLRSPAHAAAVPVDPARDRSDFLLIEALLARRLPTLAICLGCQELNIRFGGTIYQDLPSERPGATVVHRGPMGTPEQYVTHEVRVEPETVLSALWNRAATARVNSSHHQAIRDAGEGLRRAAVSPDGLIEAIEVAGHPFFIGVQWHPERMEEDPRQRALFSALVLEAGARASRPAARG